MLLDKSCINQYFNTYNRKLYNLKVIPSLLQPVPVTEGLQITKIFWKGGFLGRETDWNTPENWSRGRVPNSKDLVVISTHFSKNDYFPVIDEWIPNIAQLEIKKNAHVTITYSGNLTIDGNGCPSLGLLNLGTMMNEGVLNIQNTQQFRIHNLGLFINENELSLDSTIEEGIRESEESSFVNCGQILELLVK